VPPGTATPTFGEMPQPYIADGRQAITAYESSACRGCLYQLICPLLIDQADAATQGPCPHARPRQEQVSYPSANTAAFEDPPGVAGDGAPSGGAYPANGLISHHPPSSSPGAETGLEETCTLPADDHELCAAVLYDFAQRYA